MLFVTCSFICWIFISLIFRHEMFSSRPTPFELFQTELLLIPPGSIWGFCLALLFLVPIQFTSKTKDAANSFFILFFYRLSLLFAVGFAPYHVAGYFHLYWICSQISWITDNIVVEYLADAYATMIPDRSIGSCFNLSINTFVWLSTRQCAYILILGSITFVFCLPRLLRKT